MTLERCAAGRRMKVRRLAAAIWRSSVVETGSTIMSGSSSERSWSCRVRRRRKSSAALCAMRNSQPSGLASGPACGKASIAFTSASCSTSSPSTTEPVMRAQ
jgi:hypothetical protein